MRLLNVDTFELEEFVGEQVNEIGYAILSHTWEGKEVSFHDIQQPDAIQNLRHPPSPAWSKVQNACAQARNDGHRYIWIDTCCIDKSSSAELQEAINSMFNWYLGSKCCYAFLSDVPPGSESIADSRWFTRGWTLQELLAPDVVVFFNSAWTAIGCRGNADLIASITKSKNMLIEGNILLARNEVESRSNVRKFFRSFPVARKMSWASGRQTTRVEDRAYCLLGLFDITMPLLYGEGEKAFQRLQHEIMRTSDDCTILAWGYGHKESILTREVGGSCVRVDKPLPVGLLARSPDDFRYARTLVPCTIGNFARPSFSPCQRGFTISLPLRDDPVYDHIKYAVLACKAPDLTRPFVVLPLIKTSCVDPGSYSYSQDQEYARGSWYTVALESLPFIESASWATISVCQDLRVFRWPTDYLKPRSRITIHLPASLREKLTGIESVYPPFPPKGYHLAIKTDELSKEAAPRQCRKVTLFGKYNVSAIQLRFGDTIIDLVLLYQWGEVRTESAKPGGAPVSTGYQPILRSRATLLRSPKADEQSPKLSRLERIAKMLRSHETAFWNKWNREMVSHDLGGLWKFEVRLDNTYL